MCRIHGSSITFQYASSYFGSPYSANATLLRSISLTHSLADWLFPIPSSILLSSLYSHFPHSSLADCLLYAISWSPHKRFDYSNSRLHARRDLRSHEWIALARFCDIPFRTTVTPYSALSIAFISPIYFPLKLPPLVRISLTPSISTICFSVHIVLLRSLAWLQLAISSLHFADDFIRCVLIFALSISDRRLNPTAPRCH